MPPTLEKLKGRFELVSLSVRPLKNVLRYTFEISFMDPSSKNI